jgi:hypothetical protein
MSITTLNLGRIKFVWKGAWATGTAYIINDVVRYGGNSYTCLTAHTSNTWVGDSANWDLMAQGSSVNTTKGDIIYHGASIDSRLAIGTTGQTLTVNSDGTPFWSNPNATGAVFYVSPEGNDANNGLTLNTSFATIRRACSVVSGPATIYVKAGTYYEYLPITVPANVTIMGDGMRTTKVAPITGSQTATYVPSGSSGTTLKVSSTTNIVVGMTISGTGFASAQKVTAVVDSSTLTISANPDVTPSGTLTFRCLSFDASPVVNNLSTMWLLSDSTMLEHMLFTGMTGFSYNGSYPSDIGQATIGGVYARLNPSSAITNKSPYIKDCSAISSGGTGVIVDGSVHGSGNKSMVFWNYTCILDNGVGYWFKDGGKGELVSCFTYYCYFGYATTGGGKIRSLAGNNSYGTYGSVSRGYDSTETPVTGAVYGNMLATTPISGSFTVGETITATGGVTGTVTSVQTGFLYYKPGTGTFTSSTTVTGSTSSATATITAVTGQSGYLLVLSGLSALPVAGASIEFATGDTSAYVIQSVSGSYINTSSLITVILAQQKAVASGDATAIRIRYNFSQIRLTGHDFLSVGTGGISTTNYPGLPSQQAQQGNETFNVFPGRVYYVSTDQDGNFRVGPYFAVNQATGSATLNASAFNLSGLTSLRLGTIGAQLGAQVDEFSTDGTMSQNSSTKVPTQSAVRTYLGASYQSFVPATDLTYDLGSSSKRWRSLYVGAGSVTIGTITLSDSSGTLAIQSSGANVPVNINSINNGTSNVSVANNSDVTITAGGSLGLTVTSTGTTVAGNLTVSGTTTTVNSSTLTVNDKNIEIAKVASPTNTTADGAGITIKGTTDKTFNWYNSTSSFTSSEHITVASTKAVRFSGTSNYVGFVAPGTIASNVTWTLPSADAGASGYALTSDGAGTLSWSNVSPSISTDSSSTTLYLTMAASTSGSLSATKVNSSLTYNASTGNLSATQLTGTLQTASQTNITSVGTLTGLVVTNNQSAATNLDVFNSNSSGSGGIRVGYDATYHLRIYRLGNAADFYYNATQSSANHYFQTAGATTWTIGNTGNVTAAGTITSNSDARLKTNVETITGALDKVLALRGVMYDRISTGKREMGQIAQEAELVVPELVFTDENGIKSIAYANTVALLIEAIKEQQQQINELKGMK